MVTCPSCGSSRIRNDYKPAPIVLRVIGIRALLCDNCNFQFRAFSPLPPKNRRPRNSARKAESFFVTESASPGKVDLEKLDFPAPPTEKREPKLALPISAKPSPSLQPMQMGVAVAAGQSQPAIVSGVAVDQIAPARQDLRTEITKLYTTQGASPDRAAKANRLAQEAVDSTALTCPECGSHNIKRRKRNLVEKTFLSFTDHKPYICRKCDAAFYAKSVEQD